MSSPPSVMPVPRNLEVEDGAADGSPPGLAAFLYNVRRSQIG